MEQTAAILIFSIFDQHTTEMKKISAAVFWLVFCLNAYSQKASTETGGIGIKLEDVYGLTVVIESVVPNSPAEKAGLKAQDLIDQVNGTDCFLKSVEEVADLIRGPVGTDVEMRIKRGDEVLTFTMRRESLSKYSQPDNPVTNIEVESESDFCTQLNKLLRAAAGGWEEGKGDLVNEGGFMNSHYTVNIPLPDFTDEEIGTSGNFSATYRSSMDTTSGVENYQALKDMVLNCQKPCVYVGKALMDSRTTKEYDFTPFMVNEGEDERLKNIMIRVVYTSNPISGKTEVSLGIAPL